jgi:hypothetical protein
VQRPGAQESHSRRLGLYLVIMAFRTLVLYQAIDVIEDIIQGKRVKAMSVRPSKAPLNQSVGVQVRRVRRAGTQAGAGMASARRILTWPTTSCCS